MELVKQIKVYEVDLEETLGFETIGEMINGYTGPLAQTGYSLIKFEELDSRPGYRLIYKKEY